MRSAVDTDVTTWHLPEGAIGRLARGRVSDMSFSVDGKYLAVATPIGCWLYDRLSLKPLALFETERGMLNTIAFSHDTQLIVTSNLDGVVKVWDTQSLQCLAKIDHRKNVKAMLGCFSQLCFSQDNQYLAASCFDKQNVVYAWQKDTNAPITNFPIDVAEEERGHHFPICFSPIGNLLGYVSAGTPRHTLTISDIETSEHIADLHCSAPLAYRSLIFSPCGQYLAAVNQNTEVLVWNVYNGTLETEPTIYDGRRLIPAYTPDSTLRVADIYDHQTQTKNLTTEERQRLFRVSTLSTCGERLALCKLPRGSIEIWDIASETLIIKLSDSKGFDAAMCFSPTNEHLIGTAPTGGTGDIGVWDTQSGKKVNMLTGHTNYIITVAFHPSGKHLATVAKDRTVRLWDIVSGEQIGLFPTELPEDRSLYRGDPDQIHQYIEKNRKIGRRYKCNPYKLAFSPCGTTIACGIYDHIRLRDATTLETRMLILLPETCRKPFALTFSPCGKYLVSGAWWIRGVDRVSIRIWEVATGENIHTFWGHTTDVQDLAFTPDGELLASGSYDGTVLLWDMKPYLYHEVL